MQDRLTGLHHVTAVTANAGANVAFYTEILGLRLVKKTVNQDDVSAYHLFYGDALGRPGTEVTFFDWPWTAPRRHGTGTVSEVGLRVPDRRALEWWRERFRSLGIDHEELTSRGTLPALPFQDPEGQRLTLVADEAAGRIPPGNPWAGSPVPPEFGICGLSYVRLTVRRLAPTDELLTQTLSFERVDEYAGQDSASVAIYATSAGGPGTEVHVEERPDLPQGSVGRGGVHHVAFRTPDDSTHRAWRERLLRAGVGVTDVIDRFYFRSIYFREPGGVLFEIATDGPGFTADEDPERLGERLSLPPFLEPHRAEIEAGLRPLETPREEEVV